MNIYRDRCGGKRGGGRKYWKEKKTNIGRSKKWSVKWLVRWFGTIKIRKYARVKLDMKRIQKCSFIVEEFLTECSPDAFFHYSPNIPSQQIFSYDKYSLIPSKHENDPCCVCCLSGYLKENLIGWYLSQAHTLYVDSTEVYGVRSEGSACSSTRQLFELLGVFVAYAVKLRADFNWLYCK